MKDIKNLIFQKCQYVFPALNTSLFSHKELVRLISSSNDENDVILQVLEFDEAKGIISADVYIEFFIGNNKHINPKFSLNLDLINQRAYILGYESDLFPKIKLNVFSEINSVKYKNIIAEQDLEMLCLNWFKQLVELKYKPICKMKQIA
jgi:hypothetical protein